MAGKTAMSTNATPSFTRKGFPAWGDILSGIVPAIKKFPC
jgi:hypothetical protein